MTWVVGVTAFNGVLCVADVQVTFPFKDPTRKPLYRNCLQKIHKIWSNLYIAFSGDVRVGLNVISDFKLLIEDSFEPGTLFSLEGQLENIQRNLQLIYQAHTNGKIVDLQLMFVFVHQEGANTEYRPALCRFIAPDFRISSSGILQVDQCGSGKKSKELQVIAEYLRGRGNKEDPIYQRIFPDASDIPTFMTAKIARRLLTSEAADVNFDGVSRAYCSVIAQTGWDRFLSEQDHEIAFQIFREFGIEEYEQRSRNSPIRTWALDFKAVDQRLQELAVQDPQKFIRLMNNFESVKSRMNVQSLSDQPVFEEVFHPADTPLNQFSGLCSTWDEFVIYAKNEKIDLRASDARA